MRRGAYTLTLGCDAPACPAPAPVVFVAPDAGKARKAARALGWRVGRFPHEPDRCPRCRRAPTRRSPMPDVRPFYVVCPRCTGSGVEHALPVPCTQCGGARVLETELRGRVAALEFFRVVQPVLALLTADEATLLRGLVRAVAERLADAEPGPELRRVASVSGSR